jgi:hypothetical protein
MQMRKVGKGVGGWEPNVFNSPGHPFQMACWLPGLLACCLACWLVGLLAWLACWLTGRFRNLEVCFVHLITTFILDETNEAAGPRHNELTNYTNKMVRTVDNALESSSHVFLGRTRPTPKGMDTRPAHQSTPSKGKHTHNVLTLASSLPEVKVVVPTHGAGMNKLRHLSCKFRLKLM